MGEIRVRRVESRNDLKEWVSFPRRSVYPPESLWVPPLDRDLVRMLDLRKNPFFRHGAADAFLALDPEGKPVGRILAHIYYRHTVRHNERAAFFGYFECRDDVEVARALVDAARAFGRQRECSVLRGPFNMTAMQEMGVLLEGFDEAPAIDETYTAPYYPALFEAVGLCPVFPHTTFRIDDLSVIDPDVLLGDRHRAWLAEGRVRVRAANSKDYDREFETLRELLNDGFYANPHFVPITDAEFDFQIGPYKRLMDPAISLVAEIDGVPCGFIVAVADYNVVVRKMRGRMGPRGILAFLRGRSRIHDACLIIMGVQRQLQGRGLMRIMQAELVRALRSRGYNRLTITWIANVNEKSLGTVRALGARPLHRLTLYEAPIDLGGDTNE